MPDEMGVRRELHDAYERAKRRERAQSERVDRIADDDPTRIVELQLLQVMKLLTDAARNAIARA